MKTSKLKSLSLIVLGGALTLITLSFTKSDLQEIVESEQTTLNTNYKLELSNQVPLSKAAEGISLYRTWLENLPASVSLHGDTLSFSDVIVPEAKLELVSCLMDSVKTNLGIKGNNIPFSPIVSRDFAYYIGKADIEDAWEDVDENDSVTGIRIYTAPQYLSLHDTAKVSTHVFVVPTIYDAENNQNNDYIPGGTNKYVYDLTTPCPAACGSPNALNTFNLSCPSAN